MNLKNNMATRVLSLILAGGILLGAAGCNNRNSNASPSDAEASSSSSTPSSSAVSSTPKPPMETQTKPTKPDADKMKKYNEKKTANKDVVAWLTMPGTDIDDPLLRGPNDTKNKEHFYVRKDFNGNYDFNGSYFPDYDVIVDDREKMSNISTIYGHSMDDNPDGKDFSQIKRYIDIEFSKKNPYLNYFNEKDDMYFKVFAAGYTDINLPYFYPDKSGDELKDIISKMKGFSLNNYDVDVNEKDKLLVISTCTYKYGKTLEENESYRFLVCARLLREGESPEDGAPKIEKNPSPVEPIYPFKYTGQT